MVILTSIETETVEVFFKGKARAHCCPDLPLGDSSSKYGVQETRAVILCFGIRTGQEDDALMRWLPRPPFNTVRLFLMGVCEGHCLCASTPR